VAKARKAQAIYESFTQEQVDAIVRDMAKYVYDNAEALARMAVEETGIGNYRQNSSGSTDIFGGAGNYDTFLPIRVGGGWSKAVTERHSFNGSLDYRFR